jgi:hypothetical protein
MRRFILPVAVLAAAAIAAGCDQDLSPTGNAQLPTAVPFQIGEPECHYITFDDDAFVHGSVVTAVTSGFGFNINVAVTNDPNAINTARTYDTDHVGGPDFDLEWNGASARCAACNGLHNVLVIEGSPSFAVEGDSPDGGDITMTGFSGNGTFYIEEFKGLDQETSEGKIEAFVDGSKIGESSGQGDGSVETIVTTQTTFNTSALFSLHGSGAVDDIKVCRVPEGGGEGCTPGYWKQEQHFDSWEDTPYDPSDLYCNVFGVGPCITLLEALQSGGGGVNALLRHSVAALLNAANPDVSYDLTVGEVISIVQDAFSSGEFEDAKDEFAGFNEQVCPLN